MGREGGGAGSDAGRDGPRRPRGRAEPRHTRRVPRRRRPRETGGPGDDPPQQGRAPRAHEAGPRQGPARLPGRDRRTRGSLLIHYLDASALVKRYIHEAGGGRVRRWLASGTPATSRLSEGELASAFIRRWREAASSAAERARALSALAPDLAALT